MIRTKKYAAVFLDRDGTINEEVGYLNSLDKLKLYENTAEAIRLINASGMKTVVFTNQSGVARGYFTEEFVEIVHRHIQKLLQEKGAYIDAFYYCPHHPAEGIGSYLKHCACRKPEPGMLIAASEELDIDLKQSYAVGDMLKDVEAAKRVGVKGILVKTGYGLTIVEKELLSEQPATLASGEKQFTKLSEQCRPDFIAADLLDAVKWIMRERARL